VHHHESNQRKVSRRSFARWPVFARLLQHLAPGDISRLLDGATFSRAEPRLFSANAQVRTPLFLRNHWARLDLSAIPLRDTVAARSADDHAIPRPSLAQTVCRIARTSPFVKISLANPRQV
jgi:hypothetical protein